MEQFIQAIKKNLTDNGFPEKRVSLPLERMYEVSEAKGINFNQVLEQLATEGIEHQKEGERIIFSQAQAAFNEEMYQKAQEMLGHMSPEQLRQLQETFANMSDTEKAELFQKAKDMGLT